MSSMRNAVQRRNHKERAQLHSRKKLGLLEKRKDYSLRARDYDEKRQRLRLLRQRVSERNPDEFHFGMVRSRTDATGRKIASQSNAALSNDIVKLYKSQDAGYLRTMANKTHADLKLLNQSLLVDKQLNERKNLEPNDSEYEGTSSKMLFANDQADQSAYIRQLKCEPPVERDSLGDLRQPKSVCEGRRMVRLNWNRLAALQQREKTLAAAEEALKIDREGLSNHVGGINRKGIKFKSRERKR